MSIWSSTARHPTWSRGGAENQFSLIAKQPDHCASIDIQRMEAAPEFGPRSATWEIAEVARTPEGNAGLRIGEMDRRLKKKSSADPTCVFSRTRTAACNRNEIGRA